MQQRRLADAQCLEKSLQDASRSDFGLSGELIHEICEPDTLDEAATPIIEGLLAAAPEAVRESNRVVLECDVTMMSDAHFEELVSLLSVKRLSAEAAEGLASFLEKRDAGWYPKLNSKN